MPCVALNYSLLSGPPFPRGTKELDEMVSEILSTLPKVVFVHRIPATGRENTFSASPRDSQLCIGSLLHHLVQTCLPHASVLGSRPPSLVPEPVRSHRPPLLDSPVLHLICHFFPGERARQPTLPEHGQSPSPVPGCFAHVSLFDLCSQNRGQAPTLGIGRARTQTRLVRL